MKVSAPLIVVGVMATLVACKNGRRTNACQAIRQFAVDNGVNADLTC